MDISNSPHPDESPVLSPATTPPTAPISYAKKYHLKSRLAARSRNLRLYCTLGVLMMVGALVVAVLSRIGVPWALSFTALCIIVAALGLARFFTTRPTAAARSPWRTIPNTPDPRVRVACCGKPDPLARLAAQGPIADMAFEPVVFYAIAALKLKPHERLFWIVVSVASIIALIMLEFQLHTRITNGYLVIVTGFAIGGISTAALWPTYFRIVPGRLDILRYNTLGRNVREIIKHDLRTSAVLVDFNQRCVYLVKDGATTEIGFGAVRNPHAFAHAVLLAAISTHAPAPLPDDALVG